MEIELESVRVQLEEEAEARLDLERQLSKANQDVLTWKSKYDHECAAHTEEVEELRRKMHVRITELEEQINALVAKCSGLEKQKSRLQSEVEVLIIDLEKANTTARELQKRCEQLERINMELKSKLDEVSGLYDAAQRDNRNKAAEIVRLNHELDKTREQKDQLTRENKKLGGKTLVGCQWVANFNGFWIVIFLDENADLKGQLSDLNRRFHELELEFRRLENEREELASAYKESEAVRVFSFNCKRIIQRFDFFLNLGPQSRRTACPAHGCRDEPVPTRDGAPLDRQGRRARVYQVLR